MSKLRKINIFKITALALSILMAASCSTKKNKWNRRVYHNLTSHYNVWWNGNQSVKEGEKSLNESVNDDYTDILSVFNYGTRENALALNSTMDRAIEKSAMCIQRHSMNFNGKEYVKWIDDAFLMMGQAHFYKQDYVPARRTFDFVANKYRGNNITYTSNLWLAKTYIETEQYQKAEALLQNLTAASANNNMPKYVKTNLDLVLADYYISTGKENEAVKYLKSALLTAKNRTVKTRAMFILGQIYAKQNDNERAVEQFENVIKRHPNYEMAFESRMYIAKCSNTNDTATIMKMFRKMLNDANNIEYHDRIYFAMYEVALKNNNEPFAIECLKKSVASSRDNNNQKIKSSLTAATMLFDNSDYVLSQAYYDTAVMSMDRTYEGYDSLLNLTVVLSELVENLVTYQLQDSLLRLADMDSLQRNIIIDKLIEDYKAEQKRLEEEKALKEQLALLGQDEAPKQDYSIGADAAGWYYYNNSAVIRGQSEFRKKWNNRTLEDFWFISNKQSMQKEEDIPELTEEELANLTEEEIAELKEKGLLNAKDPGDTIQYTETDREFYLKQIPFTQEAKDEANALIAQALNNIGYIYYDNIEDYQRSIEAYTELNERYPENENELPSWYYLYKMYYERNEKQQSEHYKNQILLKYPDSNQAKIIMDPEYFIKEAEMGAQASQFYAKTFDAYKNGQYQRVRMNVERARELYANDTALMPRFEFLDAISLGYLEVVDSMAVALYRLVNTYPQSSIKPHAMEVLLKANDMYNLGLNIESARPKDNTEKEEESPYTYNPNETHYVMVIAQTRVRINPLKVRMTDFNKNNFRMLQLEVKSVMLNKQQSIITIEKFDNVQAAKDYITSLFLTDYVFGGINQDDYQIVPISISNYPIFYQQKDVEGYFKFWNKNNK